MIKAESIKKRTPKLTKKFVGEVVLKIQLDGIGKINSRDYEYVVYE